MLVAAAEGVNLQFIFFVDDKIRIREYTSDLYRVPAGRVQIVPEYVPGTGSRYLTWDFKLEDDTDIILILRRLSLI